MKREIGIIRTAVLMAVLAFALGGSSVRAEENKMESETYIGDVNSELLKFSYNEENKYISGEIVVVEWVNGESTVPSVTPKMTFDAVDGSESIEVFVTATGTNTYYFDRLIGEGLTPGKEYIFNVTSGNELNVSQYTTVPIYTGTSAIGEKGTLGVVGEQAVCYKTDADTGYLLIYGRNDTYVGNVNSVLSDVQCVTAENGHNFVSGNIVIVEWVNGESTVPTQTPKMTFESYDGTECLDVFMECMDGTNTYYFDRNLTEDMDVTKDYIFRISLTDDRNISKYKSMVATTNYMDAKEGMLWETATQKVMYKTVAADGDNQLRIYAVPKEASVPAPDASIGEILGALENAGVIAEEPEKVTTKPVVTGDNVEMEKAETYGDGFVVVTFNGKLDSVDMKDIVLKKYSDDWYALSASNSNMTVEDSYVTVNDEGKTVIIYKVADKIQGTKAVTDTSTKKFSDLEEAVTIADNYLSWQMDHGGWDKGVDEQAKAPAKAGEKKNKFSGWTAKGGGMMGTIDNEGTYTQIRHIAAVYREVPEEKYKESVRKGLDFILTMQYESGGFPQVYPKRGNYSDNVTFNDNAMINVLIMLEDIRDRRYPFDSDIISEEYITKVEESIERAIDFILEAQIETNGKLTAWCAQHDPKTYEPVGARAYELASVSGSESVAVIKFLMNQEQTPEIQTAVESAVQWLKDSEVKGVRYDNKDPNGVYFIEDANSSIWYRFYDIENNLPIFCDRDGIKKHSITEIGEERRTGYSWAGTYPKKLLTIYDSHGYYAGRIQAVVTKTKSSTADGKTLSKGSVITVESEIVTE